MSHLRPLCEMDSECARSLRFALMDIDDTLTTDGKLPAASYQALWDLKAAGLRVIPVTGRPAGWCDMIARQWPVDGVVGENGALVFYEEEHAGRAELRQLYHPQAVANTHPVLQRVRERVLIEVPGIRIAKDQFGRVFDIAFDFAEEEPVLDMASAVLVRDIAEQEGAVAKISSIHVNVWMGSYDKLSMARDFLSRRWGWNAEHERDQVLFAGDSPNDEPMFAYFPNACAVANIRRYTQLMQHLPTWVSEAESGAGFVELAQRVLSLRS